jgi:dTDP-glucose 4,6-dehydratase
VGGRNERTNLQVVERICALMDRHAPKAEPHRSLVRFVTDRPGHDHRYAIDASTLEPELGWRAQESFETGIEKTVLWYLGHDAWWRPLREGVYSGERLGVLGEGRE